MLSINKCILYGNLTRDPEIRSMPSGKNVCNFSIATNRTWKNDNGEKQEEVEFHNCVAFGKTGDLIKQYVFKGNGLYVEGRIKTNTWQDKEGVKKYKTEIIVENMQFGHKPQGSYASSTGDAIARPEVPSDEIDASQIPY